MVIQFFSGFAKKENSTARPSGTVDMSLQGILKEPCSVMTPVIKIERLEYDANPCVYTYAIIPNFRRFYFVEDWVWVNGLWEVHMKEDVLATWKDVIGAQTEYILRTDSSNNPLNFDGAITDGMYPATTNFSIDRVGFRTPFINDIADGTYVLGIISNESNNPVGAISYYAMTPAQFGTFKNFLLSPACFESMGLIDLITHQWNMSDMSEQIFKTMYNPYQYIASCIWFPVEPSAIAGQSVTTIPVGWWNFNISGKRMSSFVGFFNDGVEQIPAHPLAPTRGKYLNYAPYTRLALHGKFGTMPLDPSCFEVGDYIVNTYTVDYITGQCLFEVFSSDNPAGTGRKRITKTEFLIGVPIQLAQIGRDYFGLSTSAFDIGIAGGSLAIGGPLGAIGAITKGDSAIKNAIDSLMPQLQTSGVNGSFISNNVSTQLMVYHYVIVDEDITHRGRPLCQLRRLDTLSGYILCAEGDIDINCFDNERDAIKKYMTTGFFWEM